MNDDIYESSDENIYIRAAEREIAEKRLKDAKKRVDADAAEIAQLEALLETCRIREKNAMEARWRVVKDLPAKKPEAFTSNAGMSIASFILLLVFGYQFNWYMSTILAAFFGATVVVWIWTVRRLFCSLRDR